MIDKLDYIEFLIFAAVVFLVIFGPFIAIWSLNTLFPSLAIPYTFWTWLAALFLSGIVRNVKVSAVK